MDTSKLPLIAAAALVMLGIVAGFWPFFVLAIALCALTRHFFIALGLGLLCDILFGQPVGILHPLFFPFVLFAGGCIALTVFARRYFFEHEDGRF